MTESAFAQFSILSATSSHSSLIGREGFDGISILTGKGEVGPQKNECNGETLNACPCNTLRRGNSNKLLIPKGERDEFGKQSAVSIKLFGDIKSKAKKIGRKSLLARDLEKPEGQIR